MFFGAVGREPPLLALPTFVLVVAAERVDDVERTVRADKMEDCDGEELKGLVYPVAEGLRTADGFSLSVSNREPLATGGRSTWSLHGLSCIVAKRLDSPPRTEVVRLIPLPVSALSEADDAVDANDAIELLLVGGGELRDSVAGS